MLKNHFHNIILYKIVSLYLHLSKGDLKLLGPLKYTQHQKQLKDLNQFLESDYALRCPYLLNDEQREIEKKLNIDERSTHFILQDKDKTLAYIRLTPSAFEISEIISNVSTFVDDHREYYEFSRFTTEKSLSNKRFYAKLLLLRAGLWLFTESNAKGIIGICKPNLLKYFKQFHLLVYQDETVEVHHRPGRYYLIAGEKQKILFSISKLLINHFKFNFIKGKKHEFRTIKKHS